MADQEEDNDLAPLTGWSDNEDAFLRLEASIDVLDSPNRGKKVLPNKKLRARPIQVTSEEQDPTSYSHGIRTHNLWTSRLPSMNITPNLPPMYLLASDDLGQNGVLTKSTSAPLLPTMSKRSHPVYRYPKHGLGQPRHGPRELVPMPCRIVVSLFRDESPSVTESKQGLEAGTSKNGSEECVQPSQTDSKARAIELDQEATISSTAQPESWLSDPSNLQERFKLRSRLLKREEEPMNNQLRQSCHDPMHDSSPKQIELNQTNGIMESSCSFQRQSPGSKIKAKQTQSENVTLHGLLLNAEDALIKHKRRVKRLDLDQLASASGLPLGAPRRYLDLKVRSGYDQEIPHHPPYIGLVEILKQFSVDPGKTKKPSCLRSHRTR